MFRGRWRFTKITSNGFDVFFDFTGIAAGDFESAIIGNIQARTHFLVLLTPSALENCGKPGDWLRREIETALAVRRNIVPLMLEGFDFGTPKIADQLTGELAALKAYQALSIPPEYFLEAMGRLRERYLNVPLDTLSHPASPASVHQAAEEQKTAAEAAPGVEPEELTAQQWFERGFNAVDLEEKLRFYSEAIRLKPDYAVAFNNRAIARRAKGDLDGAIRDCNEAIRLIPDLAHAFNNRGAARRAKDDLDAAIRDYDEAIRLKPDLAEAFYNRGIARRIKGDQDDAVRDYDQAIRLKPDYATAFCNRGVARSDKGDLEGAIRDYNEAIRLKPDYALAFYNRSLIREAQGDLEGAKRDYDEAIRLGYKPKH
ncbi:MAG TPA: tetratricopeptide repeat protein [Bryobacteraceae bacterium]|nr:tetratricopeptide repeat protein [Bryobacteraceae bacterium]